MKLSFSFVALSCLLASSLSADMSTNIKKAFTDGKVSGDIVLYGEQQNNSGINNDSGFTMGSIGLGYETIDYNGLKVSLAFRGNHDFSEIEDGDYNNIDQPTAILHTANISYTNKYITLILGRQEIDLEWMEDFHEAYVGVINAIPDTTITLGHTDRIAVADIDAPLEKFSKINGSNGANVLDLKYEGIKNLALNTYYYNVPDIADWYGIKIDYNTDMFGGTIHYAGSDEDVSTTDNGSILAAEVRSSFNKFDLNLGYISTDKDAGIGSMDTVGDNINPLEDGNQVYQSDANTMYLGVGYKLDKLALNAMYGRTKYNSDNENEINIGAEYGINDDFSVGAIFINVDAENSDDDYNKLSFTANYTF